MYPSLHDFDFSSLSLDERALLAHQLWDSVKQEAALCALTDAQISESEKRLALYDAGQVSPLSIEELKTNLQSRRKNALQG